MEGGAITLELTFREATPSPGATPARSGSRSPKPRTGWYRSSRRAGRSPSATPAGEWASTDADQQSLRWHQVGTADIPALQTCVLLPWAVDGVVASADKEEQTADGIDQDCTNGPWTELGVYPPGDGRKRRQGLLMGFHSAGAESASSTSGGEGYVVALLVEAAAKGGVRVTELCRAPLEEGREPVVLNQEKIPPGTPASGRAAVEAVCADGWIRRWYVTSRAPASSKGDNQGSGGAEACKKCTCFDVRTVDLCRPFRDGDARERLPTKVDSSAIATTAATMTTTATVREVELIAVASATLLAVARRVNPQGTYESTGCSHPSSSLAGVSKAEGPSNAIRGAAVWSSPEPRPTVEVWSCSTAPYPRDQFWKEGPVTLRNFRDDQAIEGMCWVTPEVGDERGATVGGHCLCVSVGGTVLVLARERRKQPQAEPGMSTAAESSDDGTSKRSEWTWSPVFRVANPCSLLNSHTAGLRDFCQVSGGFSATCLVMAWIRPCVVGLDVLCGVLRFPTFFCSYTSNCASMKRSRQARHNGRWSERVEIRTIILVRDVNFTLSPLAAAPPCPALTSCVSCMDH